MSLFIASMMTASNRSPSSIGNLPLPPPLLHQSRAGGPTTTSQTPSKLTGKTSRLGQMQQITCNCGTTFPNLEVLERHMMTTHPDKTDLVSSITQFTHFLLQHPLPLSFCPSRFIVQLSSNLCNLGNSVVFSTNVTFTLPIHIWSRFSRFGLPSSM